MSDELKRYEAARRMVDDLCMGSRRWIMRVPVPDNDPDLVISASLEDVPKLLAELVTARARYDALLTAAWDYWHASAPNGTVSGRLAWDTLTALLGAEVEV